MIDGKISEYRIAVLGLQGQGKSGLIQRLCANAFSDTPHTESEQQSTAVWENSFVYFWEIPTDQVNGQNADSIVVGFSSIIFVFDLTTINSSDFDKSRLYLEDLMKAKSISSIPFLIVGTKADLIDDITEIKPSKLMGTLTENLKKTQLIFFSAKEERGATEIQNWILQRALTVHECEVAQSDKSSQLSLKSNF